MRDTMLLAAILLAGCGSPSVPDDTASPGTAQGRPPIGGRTAAGTGTTDCGTRPDFAPVYPGATIRSCSSFHFDATDKDAGSIIAHADATPAEVLAWAKQEAAKSGLRPGISTASLYSAMEGTKRTVMVHVEADPAGGTNIVTNWGKAP